MLTRNVIFVALLLLATGWPRGTSADVELVPIPQSVTLQVEKPELRFGERMLVNVPDGQPLVREHFRAFGDALQLLCGCRLEFSANAPNGNALIDVQIDSSCAAEEYRLTITDDQIRIRASTIKGVSHATATLLQLLGTRNARVLPQIEIVDEPDCRYRSFMVDVGRNPHSLECLKETIDLLWFYKVDSLQLHLTDDQRFAFPSKAFPKLVTERDKISWGEFQELERYAQVRGVAIIPELEVPGHSSLLIRQYPEVFGNSSTDVAQLKTSRDAIKLLLDEMIAVFSSSPYVHIGGDEAYGVPVELQRDLINDLHAHLKKQGKETVVWEGPGLGTGENKVHEEVIHLNWRTVNFSADAMLAAGYRVVNATWDPLYIVDHYPRNNFTMASPEYIYCHLDLYRFKHFNPGFPTFGKPVVVQPNDRVIGFCMPMWEGREVNFFPLIVPRIIPMAAVAWNAGQEKDYTDFATRSTACEKTRHESFYPSSIAASPLVLEEDGVFHGQTTVTLLSRADGEVRYTRDGELPTVDAALYEEPFLLDRSVTVRSAVFLQGKQIGHGSRRTFVHVTPVENLALGKRVSATVPSGPPFSVARLTDGGTGNLDYFLGYPSEPEPIEITIDLEEILTFDRIVVHTYRTDQSYESYEIQVSQDGEVFEQVAARAEKPDVSTPSVTHDFPEVAARFVRVVTHGHKGQVFDSFSRITEIQVFSTQSQGDAANSNPR